ELLHHEAASSRGRAPVHVAQRLALDVLPYAVQLVASRAAQEQPAAVLCLRPPFGEESRELDQPRVDDERLRLALNEDRARETERILDRQANGLEGVTAARHRAQLEAAGETASP